MKVINVWVKGSLLGCQVLGCSPGKPQSWANCFRFWVAKPEGLELGIRPN